jgi:hypothetical protein
MITTIHKNIVKHCVSNGQTAQEIKQIPFLQSLEPSELDILIAQTKQELDQTETDKQPDNASPVKQTSNPKKNPNEKKISIKIDLELYDKLSRYIKANKNKAMDERRTYYLKGNNKQSRVIRFILKEFLDKHLERS